MIARGPAVWLVNSLFLAQQAGAALSGASAGALNERALDLHEAWYEAQLSHDGPGLEREWTRMVRYLKASTKGRADVVVTGNSTDWRIRLTPSSGPVWVSATPKGVQLYTRDGREATPVQTLLSVYPLRRHYDCDGRALAPRTPGIPAREQPCSPATLPEAAVVAVEASSEDGAVLFPLKPAAYCFQVVSASNGVLEPGQILVKQAARPYRLHHLADRKMRLLYRENPQLFVMDRKQPKLYLLKFD